MDLESFVKTEVQLREPVCQTLPPIDLPCFSFCSSRVDFALISGSSASVPSSPLLQRLLSPSSSSPSLMSPSSLITKPKTSPLTRVMSFSGNPYCSSASASPLTPSSRLRNPAGPSRASVRSRSALPRPSTAVEPSGVSSPGSSSLSPGLSLSCAVPLYRRFLLVDRGARRSQRQRPTAERKWSVTSNGRGAQALRNNREDVLHNCGALGQFQRATLNSGKWSPTAHEGSCQRVVEEREFSTDSSNREVTSMSAVTPGPRQEPHGLSLAQDLSFLLPPTRRKKHTSQNLNDLQEKQSPCHSTGFQTNSSPSSFAPRKSCFLSGLSSFPAIRKGAEEALSLPVGERDGAGHEKELSREAGARAKDASDRSPLPEYARCGEEKKRAADGRGEKEDVGGVGSRIRESIWNAGGKVSDEYRKTMRTLLEKRINDANLISTDTSTFTKEPMSDEAEA